MIAELQIQECEPAIRLNSMAPFLSHVEGNDGNGMARFSFMTPQRGSDSSQKISQSIAYMTQHLNQPLQVSTLAAMVNVSPSHYFALFKRHTGRAPMDYFTRMRMGQARRLLDTTTASVKQVAAALGYDDPFYFSRVFKAVNQVAPSNYRVKQRAENERGEDSPCKS